MEQFPGYTFAQSLRQDSRVVFYRGLRLADQRRVLVKLPRSRPTSPRDSAELRHAFELSRTLETPAIVPLLALETFGDQMGLVFEDEGGSLLSELLGAPMELGQALALAIGVTGALANLHGHAVIHKDIRPENLVVHPETGRVQILDLALACRGVCEPPSPQPPDQLLGSLPYLSPEQTGRMDCPIDARTDLYSLGVVLYQLFTGQLPFQAEDPLEWIHCHLARTPRPPSELRPELPGVLSQLTLRLLTKAPEARYQTAAGLLADLSRCQTQWVATHHLEPFPLGTADALGQLGMPRLLHGRDTELRQLHAAFARVAATRKPELLIVTGEPGVGKSFLVTQLEGTVHAEGGLFLQGKFEQQLGTPYAAFARALQPFLRRQAAGDVFERARWRERLLSSLGTRGQLIADLIPELTLLSGPLPKRGAELSSAEAQLHVPTAFRQLLGVLCEERPLVLHLEDLQWADAASARLLLHLLTQPAPYPLLLLGTRRDHDPDPSAPLALTLAQLEKAAAPISEMVLSPLSREDFVPFLTEVLATREQALAPLAELVHDKSHGNPFVALQMLSALQREGLLVFDWGRSAWRWDAFRIRDLELSHDAVDLVIDRLRRQPALIRDTLVLAACLGSSVELETLQVASSLSEEPLRTALDAAVHEGLLLRADRGYRFLHDRVQQAAYALLAPEARAATHLNIGRRLLARHSGDLGPEQTFVLVNQLDRGAHLLESEGERLAIARLNLRAARWAKAASAYREALRYLDAGMTLLAPEPWRHQHALAMELALEEAECRMCAGELEEAERELTALLARARTPSERASALRLQVSLHTTRGASVQAIDSAIACLEQYGIVLVHHPSPEQVETAERTLEQLLAERPLERVTSLTPMRAPDMEAAMSVMAALLPTAYFSDVRLHRLVACQMVILTLQFGIVPPSAMGFAAYGLELVSQRAHHAEGARFGHLALALVEQHGFAAYEAKVCNVVGGAILPWTEPLRSLYPYLERTILSGQRSGDLLFAALGHHQLVAIKLDAGEPLGDVERLAQATIDFCRRVQFEPLAEVVDMHRHYMGELRGQPISSPGEPFASEAFAERVRHSALPATQCWYWLRRLQLHLVFGDRAAALAGLRQAAGLIVHLRGQHVDADFAVAAALTLAANWDEAPAETQAAWLAEIEKHHAFLQEVAAVCPENFLTHEALVAAELARRRGQAEHALLRYEQALQAARDSGFTQYAALAAELAARFLLSRGLRISGEAFLEQSWRAYHRWGAEAKVRQLEQLYPSLQERLGGRVPWEGQYVEPARLDTRALVRASQAISQEIVLPRLLEALMRSALEEAGAERGWLLMLEGEQPLVRVRARMNGSGTQVSLETGPEASSSEVPDSILTHVRQTRQPLLLDDASQPGPFSSEPGFASRHVRSVLCLPIVRQAKLIGVLHLENGQLTGAFTPQRLFTLEVLAAQAAISLENARLYQTAQEAIRTRDDFLRSASHELKTPIAAMKLQLQALARHISARSGKPTDARLPELLKTFDRRLSRLAHLAQQMLDVSRVHTSPPELALTEVDLAELVREQVDLVTSQPRAAPCPMELDLEAPLVGWWDHDRLEQLVTDLLHNAMKFGAGRPITLRLRSRGDRARLEVRDQGIGIEQADQARIFERFGQAASTQHYGGMGLGLYLARETVHLHGGTITVESRPGEGTLFVVELPRGGPPSRPAA
ncbi:AAA family ATPase [Vitiosangium sp. GDMCC 1.1324]|uniref:GAF domain-containing sensor histidine kinase n=1 Tax=Vitiosangium sp. (strain GDMCC 1.1324) TaxID=2138576 RepID=UPI000D3340D6|nr:AAA family ATPase [Vitiosangium sp. GDMCC 1.1324]PTL76055.1 protein kinase [Vitiosangium sp. GDMCC 1.1324]